MGTLKKYVAPLAAALTAAGIAKFVKDSVGAFTDLTGAVVKLQRVTGGTVSQVSAMRGAMQLSGMDVDKASTSLTIFSKNLNNAAGDQAKSAAMSQLLGTSILGANGQLKPMNELLPQVADKFKTMPDGAQKTALAVQLFGRSGTEMLPFLNQGAAGIQGLEDKAKSLGLTLDDSSKSKFVAYKSATRTLSATMQGLKVSVGGAVIPVFTGFATMLTNLITPAVEGFNRVLQNPQVQAFGQAVQTVMGSIGTVVASGLGKAAGLIGQLLGPIFSSLGQAFQVLGPQVQTAMSAFSPFSLIMQALAPVASQLSGLLGDVGQVIGTTLSSVLMAVVPLLASLVQTAVPILTQIIQIGLQIASAVLQPVMQVVQALTPVITQIFNALTPLFGMIATAVMPLITQVMNALMPIITSLLPPLMSIIQALIPIITAIVQAITPIITTLVSALMPVIQLVVSTIQALMPVVLAVIQFVINGIVSFINTVLLPVINAILPVVQSVIGAVTGIVQGIATVIRGVVNVISGIFSGDWSRVWNGVTQIVSGAISGITSLLDGMVNVGKNLVKGIWDGIKGMGDWLLNQIKGFAHSITDGIKSFFGIHSPSTVMRDEVGRFLAQGIGVGITADADSVVNSAKALSDQITGVFSSPSLSPTLAGAGAMAGGVYAPVTVQAPNIDSAAVVQLTATALAQRLRMV